MGTRGRIITFFGLIAVFLFGIGLWYGVSSGRLTGQAAEVSSIKPVYNLELSLSDDTNVASEGEALKYQIKVINNDVEAFEALRVYGYLGLPDQTEGDSLISKYLSHLPGFSAKYPVDNLVDWKIDRLESGATASLEVPVTATKFQASQNALFSKITVSIVVKKSQPFLKFLGIDTSQTLNLSSTEDVDLLR
jgi:hypothetical protein